MATIKLPVVPRSAYDPKRPANALLRTHARELEKALVEGGRRVKRKKPKTEEQVAAYIRHLNRALYHQKLLPKIKRKTLDVPIEKLVPGPSKRRTRSASRKRAVARRRKPSARTRKRSRRS